MTDDGFPDRTPPSRRGDALSQCRALPAHLRREGRNGDAGEFRIGLSYRIRSGYDGTTSARSIPSLRA